MADDSDAFSPPTMPRTCAMVPVPKAVLASDQQQQQTEIQQILSLSPGEKLLENSYSCEHPFGVLYLGNNHIFFCSREKDCRKPITKIPLRDVVEPHYQSDTQSISLETRSMTHFYHAITHSAEFYYLIYGKLQSWYAEYNALMQTTFQLPPSESLIECVSSTISVVGSLRNRPGTLYVSQNFVAYTVKLSEEKARIPIKEIRTASKENSLLTAKGIKIVTHAKQEYFFSGFFTRRTFVLDIILSLMKIQQLRSLNTAFVVPNSTVVSEDPQVAEIEKEFTTLGIQGVKEEAMREVQVLNEAHELSKQLEEEMSLFLQEAKQPHHKVTLGEAAQVVSTVQMTITSLRELGFVLLLNLIEGVNVIPPAAPPKGNWVEEENDDVRQQAQEQQQRQQAQEQQQQQQKLISKKFFSTEDQLTPISGGLYTITKTLLQCFHRVRKHFLSLLDYATGKKYLFAPGFSLKKPINKLRLYNEQMQHLINVIPVIVSIALTPDESRFQTFNVEELLITIKVKSFWYEYQPSLKLFVKLLNNVTAAFSKSYQYESSLLKYPMAFTLGALYAFNSEGAERRVEEISKNLDPTFARFIWNLPDKPFIRFFDHLTITSVAVSKKFVIHQLDNNNTPIHCRIISAKPLPFDWNKVGKKPGIDSVVHEHHQQPHQHQQQPRFDLDQLSVILHFHGGGFISMSPESHEVYLREWAHITQAIIVSVDYRQAPEFKFPVALNECFYVYRWLIEGHLGFVPHKITLVGDSAGGNLVASTTLKAIDAGIRPPESAILIYPAVNLVKMATPSRIINMNDPIVSYGFLQMCLDSYLPTDCNPWDMYISPLYAPDRYLKAFPTTYVMGMAFDPLLDDYVALVKRLKSLGKEVLFKLYEDMPHGVLNMVKLIPDAKKAIEDSGLWLRWSIS